MRNDTDSDILEEEMTDEQELSLLILQQADDDYSDNKECGPKVVTVLHDKDCVTFNDATGYDITLLRKEAREWWADSGQEAWDNVSIGGWF